LRGLLGENVLAKENTLKKVKDVAVILSLLNGAKDVGAEVFIWRLVGGNKHLGKVRIESLRKQRKDFCIIPSDGQDRLVQELLNSQSYIDLYIPESALLLRCNIRQSDAPYRYYLSLPDFVAQVDRRQELRLNVYERSEMKISFGKSVKVPRIMSQHFLKSCYDISSGGFSFLVSKMEAKFFEINDSISFIEFKTKEWGAKLNAEITAIRETDPDEFNGLNYKAIRVCCRFQQIDQISRKYLDKFILERIKEELHAINE